MMRLSVKNCQRLTGSEPLGEALAQAHRFGYDIGGCFNIEPKAVLEAAVPDLTAMKKLALFLDWETDGHARVDVPGAGHFVAIRSD
jgi:hypothetical protein